MLDEQGGVLPGVTVTLQNQASGVQRVAMTEADGRWRFPALGPGRYRLRVELAGFTPQEVRDIEMTIGLALNMAEFGLATGGVVQVVTKSGTNAFTGSAYLGRADYQVSNTQSMFARWAQEQERSGCNGCGGTTASSAGYDIEVPRTSLVVWHTWVRGARQLNDLRIQIATAASRRCPSAAVSTNSAPRAATRSRTPTRSLGTTHGRRAPLLEPRQCRAGRRQKGLAGPCGAMNLAPRAFLVGGSCERGSSFCQYSSTVLRGAGALRLQAPARTRPDVVEWPS